MNNYKIKIFLISLSILLFSVCFFIYPSYMIDGVGRGLDICSYTVIPSLYPFIVLSDFIIRSGFGNAVGKFAAPVTKKLFNLPGCTACTIIMSLIGGFPVGAKMISQLYESESITQSQAQRMMLFCVNAGPAFVISAVGVSMLSGIKSGIILYISLCLSSLIIGFATRFFDDGKQQMSKNEVCNKIDTGMFVQSVYEAVATILNICAWIILFMCVSEYINNLPINESVKLWLGMASEVTSGCASAAEKFPNSVLALVLGWAGFAVHCQIYPFVKKTGIKMIYIFASRLICGAIASLIAYVLFKVFPCETSAFSNVSEVLIKPYSISVPAGIVMLILGAFSILNTELARNK